MCSTRSLPQHCGRSVASGSARLTRTCSPRPILALKHVTCVNGCGSCLPSSPSAGSATSPTGTERASIQGARGKAGVPHLSGYPGRVSLPAARRCGRGRRTAATPSSDHERRGAPGPWSHVRRPRTCRSRLRRSCRRCRCCSWPCGHNPGLEQPGTTTSSNVRSRLATASLTGPDGRESRQG
jgi:hypothetical protein